MSNNEVENKKKTTKKPVTKKTTVKSKKVEPTEKVVEEKVVEEKVVEEKVVEKKKSGRKKKVVDNVEETEVKKKVVRKKKTDDKDMVEKEVKKKVVRKKKTDDKDMEEKDMEEKEVKKKVVRKKKVEKDKVEDVEKDKVEDVEKDKVEDVKPIVKEGDSDSDDMSHINVGVLLKASGEVKEIEVDMTPYTNNIGKHIICDKVSFIGQLLREPEKTNAVIMYGLNAKDKGLPKNRGMIPDPFKNHVYGDIFMIGMNANSDPEDFKFEDYDEYNENYESFYKKKYFDLYDQ